MSKKSCTSNMLEFFETLTAKAFDKVSTERLLVKIKAHGICGQIFKWISTWLKNHKQRTVINGKHSGWEAVLYGVLQGSVLGPLLFIIFINGIDFAAI